MSKAMKASCPHGRRTTVPTGGSTPTRANSAERGGESFRAALGETALRASTITRMPPVRTGESGPGPVRRSSRSTSACVSASRGAPTPVGARRELDVDQRLREQLHVGQQLGQRLAAPTSRLQDHQGADDAVAGCVLVQREQVPGTFAAEAASSATSSSGRSGHRPSLGTITPSFFSPWIFTAMFVIRVLTAPVRPYRSDRRSVTSR